MNKLRLISTITLILILSQASAKENIGSGKTAISYKGLAASCNPASDQIDLDINNVRTTLLNGGDMWWNLNDARYEIPKVDPSTGAPSVHSLFAGAIWMGGIDGSGQLKIAAQTYRQSGNDFWPGPLDKDASVTSDVCEDYDRFWKVTREDIEQHIANVTAAGGCISESQVPTSILEWPGKLNTRSRGASGQFLTINDELAPFYDADNSGHYNPECGDYPELYPDIEDVNTYGDQMIFWVYNDRGNIHTETGGQAIGIQVNAVAFAFATSDEVDDMTFYRYKIINKATGPIGNFYMAQWVDADLGCFNNDYVGCDTTRELGICYNGTATDPDCASRGYGNDPPLVGVDFFEGPLGDVDTATGLRSKLGMSAFTYYNNDFTVTGNPETAVHYYNYMTGFWKDNTFFTKDRCTARGGSMQTKFMFPSSPDLSPFPDYWSECSCNNPPADRRFLQSSGPFTLQPGAVNHITIGVVWVRPTGAYPCPSFEATIAAADDKAQALFNNFFKLVDGPDAPTLVIRELDQEIIISLVNNAGSNNIGESYRETDPIAAALRGEVVTPVINTTIDNDTFCYQPKCTTKITLRDATLPIRDPAAYDWDTIPTRTEVLSYCDSNAACGTPTIDFDSVTSATIDSSADLWITNVTFDASTELMRLIVNDTPCVSFCGTLYEFLPAAYGHVYLSNGCDSTWIYLGEGSPEFTADSTHYLTSDSCPVTSYAESVDILKFSAGDTVTGSLSGATARITADDGMGNVNFVHVSGGFTDGEFIAKDDTFITVLHIDYDTTYTNIFTDTSIVNTFNDTTYINYYADTSYDNFLFDTTYVTTVRDPSIVDTTYKFQGYRVFQLKNAQVSVQDLTDPSLARELFTVDLKDDIDKIVNFEFDPAVGADVPELQVDGENAGIRKSFRITEDQFATGSKTLINHKTYYFTAVAYAYNNYLPYNVGTGRGQNTLYLQGRRNFQKYSAIPHKWESPRSGTELQSEYGDGVKVTRLDGTGNGGWNLDLTEASVDNILSSPNHFFGNLEYEPGRGPIGVKVFDPMKVKKANFTLSMMDTTIIDTLSIRGSKDTTYISTQATWRLDITTMETGTTETLYAEKNISTINEQLITDYGISLSVNHVGLAGKAPDDFFPPPWDGDPQGFIEANGFIEATIKFDDPENQWFTGVQDEGTFGPKNWIRSGQYTEGTGPNGALPPCEYFWDDHGYSLRTDRGNIVFIDSKMFYGGILGGTWAPYGLAANWVNRALPAKEVGQCRGSYSYGPAFPWRFRRNFTPSADFQITENDLQNLQSVDLVLTSDKTKWTQCVVVELGEDSTLTEGFARKGNIRMHRSWDKETGLYSDIDTGRSWFPGYAINVETGERLNIMFGEDSWLKGENGSDMIWNPTSNEDSPVSTSEPLFGGKHYIYIMSTRYDNGEELQRVMLENFNKYTKAISIIVNPIDTTALNNLVYSKIMWVSMALVEKGFKLDPVPPNGNIVPNKVTVRLRVNVPYRRFEVNNSNNTLPQYAFSTDGLEARTQQTEAAKTACDMIRVVPNPYYAYSAYETSQLDNRVKITNLPDNCTVTIYTLGGTLIKQFNRAIGSDVSDGASTENLNLDNSLDWNLKNNKDIPVASGVYLIHVEKDGVCEKVVKWFGVLRPIDLDTF